MFSIPRLRVFLWAGGRFAQVIHSEQPSEKSGLERGQPLSLIELIPIMRELKENELASHHSMGVMFWLHRAKLTFQQEKAENNSCHWYH